MDTTTTTTTTKRRPLESDEDADAAAAAAAAGDDGDGDESGVAADNRPAKRAKNSNNNATASASASASASSSAAIVTDQLQQLASFFADERRESVMKASTAHKVTLPRLMERLVGLRSRLENSSSGGEMRVSLDEIAAAIEAMIVCMYDLMQWITLATPPMTTTAADSNLIMKATALLTMNVIESHCVASLDKITDHHSARDALVEDASKVLLSEEAVLGTFDARGIWDWKMTVKDLVADCETMVNFINQHQQFLESSDALANHAMKSMYG